MMAYLPQTLEELQQRYKIRAIPVNKDDPEGKQLYFIGSLNYTASRNESMWFSQYVVQDLIRRAVNENTQKIMNSVGGVKNDSSAN